ncbi:MAG: biotin--[acetyl-CoA-carboxylase] ligase [Phycisphaeraceae bacterium]
MTWHTIHLATVDSTNDEARRQSIVRPGQPILVSADAQTGGRGRHGRAWSSPPGGAWFSIAWPMRGDPASYEPVPLLTGLAVIESLPDSLPLEIKWPNDVLLGERKVAGILCERHLPATLEAQQPPLVAPASWPPVLPDACSALIIGIGINANIDPAALDQPLRIPAASLRAALGHDIDVAALIDRVTRRLVARLSDFEAHGLTDADIAAIDRCLAWRGTAVSYERQGKLETGVITGIAADGALVLRCNGQRRTLCGGEVQRLAPQP